MSGRDGLAERVALHAEKVSDCSKRLDVESSWRRGCEEGLCRRIGWLKEELGCYGKEEIKMRC